MEGQDHGVEAGLETEADRGSRAEQVARVEQTVQVTRAEQVVEVARVAQAG